MAAGCKYAITPESTHGYDICAGVKIVSLLGVTIQEVTSIFDSDTWKIQEDFCDRLDKKEDSKDKEGVNETKNETQNKKSP